MRGEQYLAGPGPGLTLWKLDPDRDGPAMSQR